MRNPNRLLGGTAVPRFFLVLVIPMLIFGRLEDCSAQGRHETLAETGQAAPNGNGFFDRLDILGIDRDGIVHFLSTLTETTGGGDDDRALFRVGPGGISELTREGAPLPGGNDFLGLFARTTVNESGEAGARIRLRDADGTIANSYGVFRYSGGAIDAGVREGDTLYSGIVFERIRVPSVDERGGVTFHADLTGTSGGQLDDSGLFRLDANGVTVRAREGDGIPGGGQIGQVSTRFSLNDHGDLAFTSSLRNTPGGIGVDDFALIRKDVSGLTTVMMQKGDLTPDGTGTFFSFDDAKINNAGMVAFEGRARDIQSGTLDSGGIYLRDGDSVVQVLGGNQDSPDGRGVIDRFNFFQNMQINESGWVSSHGTLSDPDGLWGDEDALFLGNGDDLRIVAREGAAAPGSGATFASISSLSHALTDSGVVAFKASTDSSSGGIYLGDGIELLEVARAGQTFGGREIFNVGFVGDDAVNNYGQVAYTAILEDGSAAIRRFTPDLHWRVAESGAWEESGKWTLGLNPAHVHDVFLDSAASLTVAGPSADTAVSSLQIGGGDGLVTFQLRQGASISASQGTVVESTGTLTGDGAIVGSVVNRGTIRAENVRVQGQLTNQNRIVGSGRVDAELANDVAGRIRVQRGEELWLSGASFSNRGLVDVDGGELQVDARIANERATGLISVRDGTLVANQGIVNAGSLAVTNGSSRLFGAIENRPGGIIQVSGGAHATFFDDLDQNGTLQVSRVGETTSVAVVLGEFGGAGGFVGGGDLFALGDLRPGNSPASVLMDGNLFLGQSTLSEFEFAGSEVGEFDQLLVTGDLGLAGELNVSLLDDFAFGANEEYLIASVGDQLSGQFAGLGEGALVGAFGGRNLFISYRGGDGNDVSLFTAVPEPGTTWAVAALGLFILGRRRRSA